MGIRRLISPVIYCQQAIGPGEQVMKARLKAWDMGDQSELGAQGTVLMSGEREDKHPNSSKEQICRYSAFWFFRKLSKDQIIIL